MHDANSSPVTDCSIDSDVWWRERCNRQIAAATTEMNCDVSLCGQRPGRQVARKTFQSSVWTIGVGGRPSLTFHDTVRAGTHRQLSDNIVTYLWLPDYTDVLTDDIPCLCTSNIQLFIAVRHHQWFVNWSFPLPSDSRGVCLSDQYADVIRALSWLRVPTQGLVWENMSPGIKVRRNISCYWVDRHCEWLVTTALCALVVFRVRWRIHLIKPALFCAC